YHRDTITTECWHFSENIFFNFLDNKKDLFKNPDTANNMTLHNICRQIRFKKEERYDPSKNVIYEKEADGYEKWREYDKNGNEIHTIDSDGEEYWYEYDDEGNVIYSKDADGYEEFYN
ncbi:MAG: RHS repeat protein, partial [Treponema sp.]|nr:RHS repeat protein [Candidatus Treponema scatequi]